MASKSLFDHPQDSLGREMAISDFSTSAESGSRTPTSEPIICKADSGSCTPTSEHNNDQPIPPVCEWWNHVIQKNTFLCLRDEHGWFDDVEIHAPRSQSCPPRLEDVPGEEASPEATTPRMTPCVVADEGRSRLLSAPNLGDSKCLEAPAASAPCPLVSHCDAPSTHSVGSSSSIHEPCFPLVAPAQQSKKPVPRTPRKAGGRAVDEGFNGASVPTMASKPAASKRSTKKHKAKGQTLTRQQVKDDDEQPLCSGSVGSSFGEQVHESTLMKWMPNIAKVVCIVVVAVCLLTQRFARAFEEQPVQKSVQNGNTARCSQEPFPGVLKYRPTSGTPRPPEMHRALPRIVLYAPCPLTSYATVAKRYTASAMEWRFVQTESMTKLEVHHHAEEPVVWHEGIEDAARLLSKLTSVSVPQAGLLTHLNTNFYGQAARGRGLVTLVPEPTLDGPAVDRKYHGMLLDASSVYERMYDFTYTLPSLYSDWVKGELGATSFPSILVYKQYPGRPVVYTGDMSLSSVLLFIEDVEKGCADYPPYRSQVFQRRALSVCDATPVLGRPLVEA